MSEREAADRLGISRGCLQGLIKNEALIRSSDTASGMKRKRSGKDEDVEKALFDWFKFTRQRNAPVNGPILMEKAKLHCADFSVSNKYWKNTTFCAF